MKTALVIGASRGIGREICLTLAKSGYNVAVAAKTSVETERLPGSVFSVSEEIESKYTSSRALPIVCDVRDPKAIKSAVEMSKDYFGRLDLAVYSAGAIQWRPVIDTPVKKYDLMHEVNSRGAYITIQEVLPDFINQRQGRILLVSPPIYSRFFLGKTPYAMTKVAMTVLVHGLATEIKGTGVSIASLWPATATESHVTKVHGVVRSNMRNAELFAEAVLAFGKII